MAWKRVALALVSWLLFAMFIGMFALFLVGVIENEYILLATGILFSAPLLILAVIGGEEVRASREAGSWEYCSLYICCTIFRGLEKCIFPPVPLGMLSAQAPDLVGSGESDELL